MVWRDRNNKRESFSSSLFFFRRDVEVFPIDAQKRTLSCFRRFFRHLCAPSSKRHTRNTACVESVETRISKKDHERRDGRRIGRPRGVVVARGRRAKGTNDDDSMFVLDDDDDGFHVIAATIRDGECLSFFSLSLSLSLSFSLSSKAKTKTNEETPKTVVTRSLVRCFHRRRRRRTHRWCVVYLLSFVSSLLETHNQHRTQS